jgi:quercetin dioxygenase-like cupin family protein
MVDLMRRDFLCAAGALAVAPSIVPTLGLADEPTSPAIARLQDALDQHADRLGHDPMAAIRQIQASIRAAAAEGAFDPWTGPGLAGPSKTKVIDGGAPLRGWKVQVFRIPAGVSHPPHCHENLVSCLVVLQGRLRLREFDRDRAAETGDWTLLTPASHAVISPGDGMVTTEVHRNAHWFGAVDGPVLAVNFKASGYVRPELLRLRNRRYLAPEPASGEKHRAPFLNRADAHQRYAGRMV